MIIQEMTVIGRQEFCHHYSDNNKMIRKVGTDEIYSEAYDILPCIYQYEETDKDIEHGTDE